MLESQAVEWLFARLLARYGSGWLTKWEGVPATALKADWGRELAGMNKHQVLHALGNLPLKFPPNAAEFRELCIEAPEPDPPKELPPPAPSAEELARRTEILAKLKEINFGQVSREKIVAQIKDFRARAAAGERLSFAQRSWLAAAAHLENELAMPGDFRPIAAEALPAAMRPDAHTVAPDESAPA